MCMCLCKCVCAFVCVFVCVCVCVCVCGIQNAIIEYKVSETIDVFCRMIMRKQ